ncbi:MAG: hypothetical protein H6581_29715 [Bacteroidia bacterium]|nr:hypothetical protein [Bacteroidia bacterium]
MRTADDNLFNLVKSLNPSEKEVVFKLLRRDNKNGKLLKIFKIINSQPEHDEEEIKSSFRDDPLLNNFSHAKKQLINEILWALLAQKRRKREDVGFMIEQAEFLLGRNQINLSKGLLNKAKSFALEKEYFTDLQTINHLERKLAYHSLPPELLENKLNELAEEFTHYAHNLDTVQKLNLLLDSSYLLFKRYQTKGGGFPKELLNKVINDSKITSGPLCVRARRVQLALEASSNHYLRNYSIAQTANSELIFLYSDSEFIKEEFFPDYASRLMRRVFYEFHFGNLARAGFFLKDLSMEGGDNQYHRFIAQDWYNLLALSFSNEKSRVELGDWTIAGCEEHYSRNKARFDEYRKLEYEYWIGVGYFKLGRYQKCISYFRNIINDLRPSIGIEFQCMARILIGLTIFEMNDIDLWQVYERPSKRFLQTRGGFTALEAIIFKFLKNAMDNQDKGLLSNELKKLKGRIIDLKDQEATDSYLFNYFDILGWVEGKLGFGE